MRADAGTSEEEHVEGDTAQRTGRQAGMCKTMRLPSDPALAPAPDSGTVLPGEMPAPPRLMSSGSSGPWDEGDHGIHTVGRLLSDFGSGAQSDAFR